MKEPINLVELAKRCGLYNFNCSNCGQKQSAMFSIRRLFELILIEASNERKVKIVGFGTFVLKSWKANKSPIAKKCEKIYRLSFKASKKAKKKIMKGKV